MAHKAAAKATLTSFSCHTDVIRVPLVCKQGPAWLDEKGVQRT